MKSFTLAHGLRFLVLGLAAVLARTASAQPDVTTLGATNVSIRQATLGGSIDLTNASAACFFEWGATTNYGSNTAVTNFLSASGTLIWSNTLTGLLPGTIYHYRAVATNSTGLGAGLDKQFNTKDADALVSGFGSIVSYVNGGVGFSFIPSVDIVITRVSYYSWLGAVEPYVGLWASNTFFAGTDMELGASNELVSLDVAIPLTAGQQYSITLEDRGSGTVVLGNIITSAVMAPELTYYSSEFFTNGVFGNFNSNIFYEGVTFSFRIMPPPGPPLLRIFTTISNAVVVAWSAPDMAFLLEQNTNLNFTNWVSTTNRVNFVLGENQVIFPAPSGNLYFRLRQNVGPFTLATAVTGLGAITRSPDQTNYTLNASVLLTAVPSSGWGFLNWSGDASGTNNPLTVVMSTNKSITATFGQLPPPGVLAQWDFNSAPADTNLITGTTAPVFGSGTASLIGGTTGSFAGGDTVNDPAPASDNSAWSVSNFPSASQSNKTAGVEFDVSTAGHTNIRVSWSQRAANQASKYARLQYTTNGTTFIDFPTVTGITGGGFETQSNNLAGITGVNNNANFRIRIVTEFESTATGSGQAKYVTRSGGGGYSSVSLIDFDLVTVWGD